MANTKPKGYLELAALAVNVARKWQQNNPAYTTTFINANDLAQSAQAFKAMVEENQTQKAVKRTNTIALKKANIAIEKALFDLKAEIKYRYRHEEDLSAYYEGYGMVKRPKANGSFYILPDDNTARTSSLNILVAKLSDPTDPLHSFLQQWSDLRNNHDQLWTESLDLKTDKSTISRKSMIYKEETQKVLGRLAAQIKVDFMGEDVNKRLREFGFLKETFDMAPRKKKEQKKVEDKNPQQTQASKAPNL